MAINTLEMAKIFQQELDKQMLTAGTSGWMEANASNSEVQRRRHGTHAEHYDDGTCKV